jgi:phosphoribosylformylglycinamidine synthase subunit PurQ / glutaminase
MNKTKALIFSGYGLNCEEETQFAFNLAGASADIVHINDLIEKKQLLNEYQILAFPGGFSYGDDTGAGNAFANKIKNHLQESLKTFVEKDHLIIGICNGFQIIANIGLLPAINNTYGQREVALIHNDSARYTVRFVDLQIKTKTPWFNGMTTLSVPIAHGEGKFYTTNDVLSELKEKNLIAAKYFIGETSCYQSLEANPNGSLENIAAITDESGKIIGIMPHPERAIFFTQLPNWQILKKQYRQKKETIPTYGPGLQVFQNAVEYFK